MLSDEINEKIKCALDCEHYLVRPIALQCGHSVCRECIPSSVVDNQKILIKCGICGDDTFLLVNSKKLNEEFQYAKQLLRNHLSGLYESSRRSSSAVMNSLQDVVETIRSKVINQVEYAKEEVEIRVESIKIDLDRTCEELKAELESKKTILLNVVESIKISEYEAQIEKLKENIEKNNEQSVFYLNQLNSKVKDIGKQIKDLNIMNYELIFKVNEQHVESTLVGEVEYLFENKSLFTRMNIINRLKSAKFTISDTPYRSTDSCLIYDQNYILTANYRDNCLTLYDKNLNLFQKIDKFNGFNVNPFSVTTNSLDRVYMSDRDNHRIFMFDYKFQILAVVGSRGASNYQFEYPRGLAYASNSLFICDWINKRIQKFSPGLLFKESFKLDYSPIQIKVVNSSTVCVRGEKTGIYFYDLLKFKIKHKYETHAGSIYSIENNFYEYSPTVNKFYCFDDNGELITEIDGFEVGEFKLNEWTNMVYFNDTFIVLPESCAKMISF